MRITILNGEPDPGSAFHAYVHAVGGHLAAAGHEVATFDLRALDLQGCSGCFGCWVKTPGECVKRDDSARICRAAIQSGLLVLASPITLGFTSVLLKRAVERMIPLLHPNFVIQGGEVHHRARYAHYPDLGLLLAPGPDADAEDLEITTALWTRLGRNFKSSKVLTAVADRPALEVAHAFAPVA
jgi:multimeric flavodoxin WrbA